MRMTTTVLKRVVLTSALLTLFFATGFAVAATTTFNDIARGAYSDGGVFGTGGSGNFDGNYLTGFYTGGGDTEYRSFFTFDLTGLAGTVTSATFSVDLGPPAFGEGPSPVTLNLVAYSGDISILDSGGAGVAGFAALASGTFLGSLTASTTDTGVMIITLNSAALAAIQAAEGSYFAIGGSLVGTPPTDYLFGNSILTSPNQLVVDTTTIPEPSTLLLVAPGALGVAILLRRKIMA